MTASCFGCLAAKTSALCHVRRLNQPGVSMQQALVRTNLRSTDVGPLEWKTPT